MKLLTVFALLASLTPFAHADDTRAIDLELKKTWPNNRTVNLVFHGHSVPSGYHRSGEVKPFESYPHLFRTRLNERYPFAVVNVITTAIGGENATRGATRFEDDVFTHRPDLIFIDYAINDRNLPLDQVETAWRSMITSAKARGIPLVLITPTGVAGNDLSDPADPLASRAQLIRDLAAEQDVMLADVSAAWQAALNSGVVENTLLSQSNHPNLAGHTIAADVLYETFLAGLGSGGSISGSAFPQDASTNTFTTVDTLLTFTTTNLFSGQGNFIGDSGGVGNRVNSWDGTESLNINLADNAELTGFNVRWTVANLIISGLQGDPGASVSTVNGRSGMSTWDQSSQTLILSLPWDAGIEREIVFSDPSVTLGASLDFSFFAFGSSSAQASFTNFGYQAENPPIGMGSFHIPVQFDGTTASFRFDGTSGFTYNLETSPDLDSEWTVIKTTGPLTRNEFVVLSDVPNESVKFYRISAIAQ